jgi:hypothetical protein
MRQGDGRRRVRKRATNANAPFLTVRVKASVETSRMTFSLAPDNISGMARNGFPKCPTRCANNARNIGACLVLFGVLRRARKYPRMLDEN